MYTCPMHQEIVSDTPGTCPKCHMNLVLEAKIKPKIHHVIEDKGLGRLTWRNYIPLITIIGIIVLTTIALSVRDLYLNMFNLQSTISYFMIGFFLTFAGFKLMDIKGFAEGYQTYDLLAQKLPAYGYIYPFIELFFGLAMILMPLSAGLIIAEIAVMSFSGIGVAIKVVKKEDFMCACLGTFLKVPLTKITLIEDFGMAGLAIAMLVLM